MPSGTASQVVTQEPNHSVPAQPLYLPIACHPKSQSSRISYKIAIPLPLHHKIKRLRCIPSFFPALAPSNQFELGPSSFVCPSIIMFETPNSSCESLINHCWWNACGGTSIGAPSSKSCRLPLTPLMPARWRMVEGMVDHGSLLRRENSGSTITESEDGLDTGEQSPFLFALSLTKP